MDDPLGVTNIIELKYIISFLLHFPFLNMQSMYSRN